MSTADHVGRVHPESRQFDATSLQRAIFSSANFSSIATDAKGVIQIFNVGAEKMLGYAAAEVTNNITPADICDPEEILARAKALSAEMGTHIEQAKVSRVPRARIGSVAGPWSSRSLLLDEALDATVEEFLEISVADTGIGIAADQLVQLFKPFSQIDSGLSRRFDGTGLGLVMVKILAELHGGAVAVASAAGEGSRFSVWLPLRAPGEFTRAVDDTASSSAAEAPARTRPSESFPAAAR